jgi:hypothetical protein
MQHHENIVKQKDIALGRSSASGDSSKDVPSAAVIHLNLDRRFDVWRSNPIRQNLPTDRTRSPTQRAVRDSANNVVKVAQSTLAVGVT